MGLTTTTIDRLFEDGSAHSYRQSGSETVDLYCHVVEGAWCYFVPQGRLEPYDGRYDPQIENEANRIESEFAKQITRELGVEYIAQSRNNGVKCVASVRRTAARPWRARSIAAAAGKICPCCRDLSASQHD